VIVFLYLRQLIPDRVQDRKRFLRQRTEGNARDFLFAKTPGICAAYALDVDSRKRKLHCTRQSKRKLCQIGIGMAHPCARRTKPHRVQVHHGVNLCKLLFSCLMHAMRRAHKSTLLPVEANKDKRVLARRSSRRLREKEAAKLNSSYRLRPS